MGFESPQSNSILAKKRTYGFSTFVKSWRFNIEGDLTCGKNYLAPRAKRGVPNKFFRSGFNNETFYIHQKIKKKTLFENAHILG